MSFFPSHVVSTQRLKEEEEEAEKESARKGEEEEEVKRVEEERETREASGVDLGDSHGNQQQGGEVARRVDEREEEGGGGHQNRHKTAALLLGKGDPNNIKLTVVWAHKLVLTSNPIVVVFVIREREGSANSLRGVSFRPRFGPLPKRERE